MGTPPREGESENACLWLIHQCQQEALKGIRRHGRRSREWFLTRLSITVPASLIEGLARMALEENRSLSNLAAHLLAEHVRENGREE